MPRKKNENLEENTSIFPQRLQELLEEEKMSQQAVADYLGITRQAVNYYIKGKSLII